MNPRAIAIAPYLALAHAGLPSAAGVVPPAGPIAIQTAPPLALTRRDYVECPGNVHPLLASARQLGPADAQAPMARMILALKLRPAAEARLAQCLAALQDSGSPSYHRWLTPEQFGAAFGPCQEDLDRVTAWLESSGFDVEEVAPGRCAILFSGTVAEVERAFRTPIRRYEIDGQARQANVSDPSIPRDLAGLVEGVVSLHNIPHPALNRGFSPVRRGPSPGLDDHPLTPGDFAIIYDADPLYRDGVDGSGVAIAIVGRTRFPLADAAAFRSEFGLPARAPEIIVNGPDPDDWDPDEVAEADLDVQWSGAVARNAAIRFVTSRSTGATDGVELSALYIVSRNLAPILSVSFGECESRLGATATAFYRNLWAQAAAQGITALVASGDSGPAGCAGGMAGGAPGAAVSGLASTPFDVAVGGTQFDEAAGSGGCWRDRKRKDGSSARGYIPERAWNESGATAFGSGFWAGGGGCSACHPRPAWQLAPGVPRGERFRCLPDVALAAAGDHDGYLVETGGRLLSTGGTSCSCPAFAGLMALVVQKTGERQGNPDPALYLLGSGQYRGCGPAVFHDITAGDTSVPGTPGYPCGPGYDLATGLGSVDARALVEAWSAGAGNNIEATIRTPAADLSVASGTQVAFAGSARASHPGVPLSYAWDFGDGGRATGASCSHVFRNLGPGAATCTVGFTATGPDGAAGADLRRVTVAPGPAEGELIVNGGFEQGSAGWTDRAVATGMNPLPAWPPRQGSGDAWFTPRALRGSLLAQTVAIPARAASARLSFWLRIAGPPGVPQALDRLQVKVRGGDGPLATLATFTNLDAAPGYQEHSFDLGAYRGQRLELAFTADTSLLEPATFFVLDDVSLVAK